MSPHRGSFFLNQKRKVMYYISMLDSVIRNFSSELLPSVYAFLGEVWPLMAVVILLVMFWDAWLLYIRAKFLSEQDYVLQEIKLPREYEFNISENSLSEMEV